MSVCPAISISIVGLFSKKITVLSSSGKDSGLRVAFAVSKKILLSLTTCPTSIGARRKASSSISVYSSISVRSMFLLTSKNPSPTARKPYFLPAGKIILNRPVFGSVRAIATSSPPGNSSTIILASTGSFVLSFLTTPVINTTGFGLTVLGNAIR